MIIFAWRFEGGEKGRHVGIWERNISSKENNRGKKTHSMSECTWCIRRTVRRSLWLKPSETGEMSKK